MGPTENGIPAPPPPPPTTSYQHRFSKGSSTTAARDMWERLFDEAYKADVIVHTDCGGKIYAHASILVRSPNLLKIKIKICLNSHFKQLTSSTNSTGPGFSGDQEHVGPIKKGQRSPAINPHPRCPTRRRSCFHPIPLLLMVLTYPTTFVIFIT